jgi:predicted enzyme related to lactoylglutathione lyase
MGEIRWGGLAIDCADAQSVASFYEQMLGFERTEHSGPKWVQLRDPEGGVHLNIQAEDWYVAPTWPEEPGQQAKMMHFEVQVDDLEDALERTVDAGGSIAPWQPPDRDPSRIRIVLDPAGHPLCLFVSGE